MRMTLPTARTSILAAAAVAAALTLGGCAAGSGTTGPAATGTAATGTAEFAAPDVAFAQMMIPHHEQAVEMSDEILAKDGVDPAVVDLATEIKAAQAPEITQMESWLEAWGADRAMAGMDHGTDGMMSDDDMAALADASGAKAGELFLEQMVMHHEGAIAMAKTELATGKNSEAKALAQAILTSQTEEITVMKKLLAAG